MNPNRRTLLLVAAVVLPMAGCASTAPVGPREQPVTVAASPEVVVANTPFRKEYVLTPEDTLDIVVLRHPEISRACVVRPDGQISVPMLDEVPAAGLTPKELDTRITEGLTGRVLNPEVTVVVTQFRPPSAYVMGEVAQPSAVPLRDASTVLQAISRCGDFTSLAAADSVVLIRLDEQNQLLAMRLSTEIEGRDRPYLALSNVPIKADDVIIVPKTSIGRLSTYLTQNVLPILGTVSGGVGAYTGVKYIKLIDRQLEWLEKETDRIDSTSTITPSFTNPNP